MFNVEHTIFIKRPPQEVFDMIALPENMTLWSGAETAEWETPEPPAAGSRQRITARFLGLPYEAVNTVEEWLPPRRYVVRSEGSSNALMTHIFAEHEGGTELKLQGEIDMVGFVRFAEPLLKGQVNKRMETNLNAVKMIMESAPVQVA